MSGMRVRLASLLLLLGCVAYQAPTYADSILGVYVFGGIWDADMSGDVRSNESALNDIDTENDLGIDGDNQSYVSIALEHPLPLIPNIKLVNSELEVSGESTLTRTFTFAGQGFSVSDQVASDVDLSHQDLTLYYEVLDNWVSLDLGLTIRLFDGGVTLSNSSGDTDEALDDPLPMLYAKGKFDLPFTGLYVQGEANFIGYSGHSILDATAGVGYESRFGLTFFGGWRQLEIVLDDLSDLDVDLTISGPMLSLGWHL